MIGGVLGRGLFLAFSVVFLAGGLSLPPAGAADRVDRPDRAGRTAGGGWQPRCLQGYVWREAAVADYVCVTPDTRERARYDNAMAPYRRAGYGPYGPDTCLQGYVWREATPVDRVCVTTATRDQVRYDNSQAPYRYV
ncbi:hypothetical protein AB0D67_02365 [Streptosporangium sp. NPDC048047]|uniref:hypothetical protein n=1 Tax=Streptosporangium sp. NPDC048047 TaxID=3155748 RepID=UPI003415DDB1